MTRRAKQLLLIGLVAFGGVASVPMSVSAQSEPVLELDARLVRRYGLSSGFDPLSAASVSSVQDVAWVGNVGIERASQCVVLSVTSQGATALTYKHQGRPTACASVILGESGEIFLRGFDPTIMNNAVPSGFTAMLDASGTLKWAIDDTQLVNAEPRSEGGTGDFIGAYGGISGLMAYQPEQRALIAFSVGSLQLGLRATPVTQAHIVGVDTGRLRRTGQGFGSGGAGLVNGAVVEPGSTGFLLYTRSVAGAGGQFFRYDGRSSIDAYKPFDVTWESRTLLALEPNIQRDVLALLWFDGPATNERVRLSMTTGAGDPLFELDLPGTLVDALGNSVELGRPVRLYVGARYTIVQYLVGALRYMRVVDSGSGELLGGFYLEDVTQVSSALGVLRAGDAGELRLTRWDRTTSSIEEFAWTLVEEPEPGADMDVPVSGDMGGADMGASGMEPEPELVGISGSQFCATAPMHRTPYPLFPGALLLLGILWRGRTREMDASS